MRRAITLAANGYLNLQPIHATLHTTAGLRKTPHDVRTRRGGNGGLSINAILDVTSHSQDGLASFVPDLPFLPDFPGVLVY
jgi:hypothetical protein